MCRNRHNGVRFFAKSQLAYSEEWCLKRQTCAISEAVMDLFKKMKQNAEAGRKFPCVRKMKILSKLKISLCPYVRGNVVELLGGLVNPQGSE